MGSYAVSLATYTANAADAVDHYVLIADTPGVPDGQVKAAVSRVLAGEGPVGTPRVLRLLAAHRNPESYGAGAAPLARSAWEVAAAVGILDPPA